MRTNRSSTRCKIFREYSVLLALSSSAESIPMIAPCNFSFPQKNNKNARDEVRSTVRTYKLKPS